MLTNDETATAPLFDPSSDVLPPPGPFIRAQLKSAGFSIPSAAIAMMVNRANLNNVLLGKAKLTHDMAFRLNVLVDPDDEGFMFARRILGMQVANDWHKTASLRALARVTVGVGRKYGEMHEAGADGHLTLTTAGLRRKLADDALAGDGAGADPS